jgi:2'-5' RNA ligase
MMSSDVLRTFIALELGDDLRTALADLQTLLKRQVGPRAVRWVRPEGIHLTLKFLGDTPVDDVPAIQAALAQAAAQAGPFVVRAEGLGCFPNLRRPRVVWVGVSEPTGALQALRDGVESHVAPLGYPTERRRFSPHLTLGRVHRRARKSEAAEVGQVVRSAPVGLVGQLQATHVRFIKSDLHPTGAVYATLLEAPFGRG